MFVYMCLYVCVHVCMCVCKCVCLCVHGVCAAADVVWAAGLFLDFFKFLFAQGLFM